MQGLRKGMEESEALLRARQLKYVPQQPAMLDVEAGQCRLRV